MALAAPGLRGDSKWEASYGACGDRPLGAAVYFSDSGLLDLEPGLQPTVTHQGQAGAGRPAASAGRGA